jgi:hypothetical protein
VKLRRTLYLIRIKLSRFFGLSVSFSPPITIASFQNSDASENPVTLNPLCIAYKYLKPEDQGPGTSKIILRGAEMWGNFVSEARVLQR